MRVLLISNGSGEDRIAAQLGQVWREAQPEVQLRALALVGSGLFYQQVGIELLGTRFTPPSQGFAYLHPKLLLQDFRAGLGQHLQASLSCLKSLRGELDAVLAVGDIVAVIAAEMTRTPYAFVGCALSDYYLGEKTRRSSWDLVQRQLLKRSQALVFARDQLTADNLRRRGLKAHFVGNPMLDCLDQPEAACPYTQSEAALVLLLPGSHSDAPGNFALMLEQLDLSLDRAKDFVTLCAPQLDQQALVKALQQQGWQAENDGWRKHAARLWLLESVWFRNLLPQASLALGLAGTANEQCVGHGLPVLSFAARAGAQYTWAFGEAQQRLLGAGLSFVGEPHPQLIAWQIERMLTQAGYRSAAAAVAAERFGEPGADRRIISRCRAEFPSDPGHRSRSSGP